MAEPVDELSWSPYDASVPHTTGLPDAQARFAWLRERRRPAVPAPLSRVGEVVVVVASSRGGSTLLGEILRRCHDLLHLRAEMNPLFVVAGLAGGDTAVLTAELAAEIGQPASTVGPEELEDLALTIAWRLTAQWPELSIDPEDAIGWVHEAVSDLRWTSGRPVDSTELHLRVLGRARSTRPALNPYYYDLPPALVAERFPDVASPQGPPGRQLVEMPPYVLVRPWARPNASALAARPLILSTPRNAFRLPFLRALFPAANFRVIHLTRNPAAALNGLIDGWQHHGFFNVAVDIPLQIAGYSDTSPEWGRSWWNFDLPPAWRSWTRADLPSVCGEQWRSHHAAVLEFLDATGSDSWRVRHEDVVGPGRNDTFADLGEWLGVGDGLRVAAKAALPPLMATAPPRPRRWQARAGAVEPVVSSAPVQEIAARLGYEDRSTWT